MPENLVALTHRELLDAYEHAITTAVEAGPPPGHHPLERDWHEEARTYRAEILRRLGEVAPSVE
jgi:hypothetical protein